MRSFIGWIIIACVFTAIVAGYFALKNASSEAPLDVSFATTTLEFATSSMAAKTQASPPTVPAGYKEYRNTDYGFSLYYPGGISPQEFHDSGYALTVTFQGWPGQRGFQVYVAPINGTKVTPERFQLDEPSGVRQELHATTVDGAPAVAFYGLDATVGKTSEVWFIHGGFLYEVTTYKELDTWLGGIMRTWRFI